MLRVREGFDTVCVARHETVRDARMAGSVCNRRPIGVGAAGEVFVAHRIERERQQYLARRAQTAPGGTAAPAGELASNARRGHAIGTTAGPATTAGNAVPDGRG
ncbi:IclR family transcriptional regulator, partial [Burkholderia pseudomallei]